MLTLRSPHRRTLLIKRISLAASETEGSGEDYDAAPPPTRSSLPATAVIAAIGNGAEFNNGCQLAAWIGLVPRQFSSGDRTVLMEALGDLGKDHDPSEGIQMVLDNKPQLKGRFTLVFYMP